MDGVPDTLGSTASCCGCGGTEVESSREAGKEAPTCLHDPPTKRGVAERYVWFKDAVF